MGHSTTPPAPCPSTEAAEGSVRNDADARRGRRRGECGSRRSQRRRHGQVCQRGWWSKHADGVTARARRAEQRLLEDLSARGGAVATGEERGEEVEGRGGGNGGSPISMEMFILCLYGQVNGSAWDLGKHCSLTLVKSFGQCPNPKSFFTDKTCWGKINLI